MALSIDWTGSVCGAGSVCWAFVRWQSGVLGDWLLLQNINGYKFSTDQDFFCAAWCGSVIWFCAKLEDPFLLCRWRMLEVIGWVTNVCTSMSGSWRSVPIWWLPSSICCISFLACCLWKQTQWRYCSDLRGVLESSGLAVQVLSLLYWFHGGWKRRKPLGIRK